MAKNCRCPCCGREFHWCVSCSCLSDTDMAMSDGYCSTECARVAQPLWQPSFETDEAHEAD